MEGMPLQRSYAIVTTCHAAGYEAYGRTMLETFLEHWPAQVPLLLYREGFEAPASQRIQSRDLEASSPGLMAFKQRHADNPQAHGRRPRWSLLRLGSLPWPLPFPMPRRKASYR